MQEEKMTDVIESAIKKTAEMNPQETDGEWLEVVTVESGPLIKEWDLSACWHWFVQCQDSSLEKEYEKVALYEKQDEWMHAALQTPNGRWRSKMGQGPVIEHLSPESLSGGMYGNPTVYMRRALNTPEKH